MDNAYVGKGIFIFLINFNSLVVFSERIINLLMIKEFVAFNLDCLGLLSKLSCSLIFHQSCNISIPNYLTIFWVCKYFIKIFDCLIKLTDPNISCCSLNQRSCLYFVVKLCIFFESFPFQTLYLSLDVITIRYALLKSSHFYESRGTI